MPEITASFGKTTTLKAALRSALTPLLVAVLVVAVPMQDATAGPISELVIFDASLSDSGQGTIPPPFDQFYFQNRASNGIVWVEYLAPLIGVPTPLPSLQGGTNYAVGGATLADFWPNVGGQIDAYLGDHTPSGDEIFIVRGSLNEFTDGERDPTVTIDKVLGHITTLANAGAETFLVPNLVPMEHLPIPGLDGSPVQQEAAIYAADYKVLLSQALNDLEIDLGIDIVLADHYTLVADIIADPAAYGLTNATDFVFDMNNLQVLGDPDEYFWWDIFHPTTAGHSLLAFEAFEKLQSAGYVTATGTVVPEPSSMILAGTSALACFALVRRRRRRTR